MVCGGFRWFAVIRRSPIIDYKSVGNRDFTMNDFHSEQQKNFGAYDNRTIAVNSATPKKLKKGVIKNYI